jgi:hypothetical protein
MLEFFLVGVYIPEKDTYVEFRVNRWVNELDKFIRFTEKYSDYYWVGYNNLRFDSQVIEWVMRNHENWHDLSGLEIASKIAQKAQDVIHDANYEVLPEFSEKSLSLKQLDLFTIWHFQNENRRTSLKALQFYMNWENIEEMPIHHAKEHLTEEEITLTKDYCKNDVMSTYEFYKLTRGDASFPLYKGKDKIADRLTMQKEFGLDCLNWDDVKIGAEWNKIDYMTVTKKQAKDLKPDKIKLFYGKRFKQFFPKWCTFQTPELQKFVKNFGDTFVMPEKQEFKYVFNQELTATIAKGGVHSNEKPRWLIPSEDEQYWQVDIGSQYPNAIRKYKVEPSHLPGWNNLIVSKIDRRLSYKAKYKETGDPTYNSLQEMGKLALNGGSYGRLNTKGDWQEYPYGMLQVTIGGQLEILMVVEDLILKGFRVVSLNTDGFDCIIKKDREKEFKEILSNWEVVIGNDVLGNFEYTQFQWIVQTSVNDYIALKMDGKTKQKGDFAVDVECHKNSSARIIPIALEKYYVEGVSVEQTIRKHTNIFDFCLRQKASKDFHYEGMNRSTASTSVYHKLIRYYVSKTGEKLMKIKNADSQSTAPDASQVEAGEWVCTVCNYLTKNHPLDNIKYEYYIERAERMVRKIETEGKKSKITVDPNQLSLF